MELLMVLGLGLVLGMQHATDADHLAAVATLSGREGSLPGALRLGLAWGMGHSLTLLVVVSAVAGLGWVISAEWAGRFEQVVGVMLMLLGLRLAWRMRAKKVHFHNHMHADAPAHFHGHSHAGGGPHAITPAYGVTAPRSDPAAPHQADPHHHAHRLPTGSLLVGMVHGLAGSAALALLASATMPSLSTQVLYVAVFGVGSMLGMALLSGALAVSLRLTAHRLTSLHRGFNLVVALISVGLGLRLALGGGA